MNKAVEQFYAWLDKVEVPDNIVKALEAEAIKISITVNYESIVKKQLSMIRENELREAIMRVKGIVIIDKDDLHISLEDLKNIIDVLPEVTGDFPITSVCRADLEAKDYDVDKISDDDMRNLARKMSNDYCDQLFWESMDIIAESMGFPKVNN